MGRTESLDLSGLRASLGWNGNFSSRAKWRSSPSRKAIISPRVTLPETIFAGLLVCVGIVALVGTVTATPDDQRDLQFIALLVGGLLWGVLASLTIAARILQWRIRKKTTVVPSLA